MSATRTVERFEFRDLGVDHAQYFQGAGVAYTDWDAVYVGVGDTAREAADGALEQFYQASDAIVQEDFLSLMERQQNALDNEASAHEDCTCECEPGNDLNECLGDCHDDCELNHYVALYVKIR